MHCRFMFPTLTFAVTFAFARVHASEECDRPQPLVRTEDRRIAGEAMN